MQIYFARRSVVRAARWWITLSMMLHHLIRLLGFLTCLLQSQPNPDDGICTYTKSKRGELFKEQYAEEHEELYGVSGNLYDGLTRIEACFWSLETCDFEVKVVMSHTWFPVM